MGRVTVMLAPALTKLIPALCAAFKEAARFKRALRSSFRIRDPV
ncbi:hypothetical protein PC122_g22902 [Phytophthora cactorum]|nr:hypothetical protein PC122_g22902 [Phytophthora cactorum]